MIYIKGTKELIAKYHGTKVISAIYHGSHLVWSAINNCFSGIWRNSKGWINKDPWHNNL